MEYKKIIAEKDKEIELLKKQNNDLFGTLNTLQNIIKRLESENEQLKSNYKTTNNNEEVIVKTKNDNLNLVLNKLGINAYDNSNKISDSLTKIHNSFKAIPLMQNTIEKIYEIINSNKIFTNNITNNEDLVNTIQAWSLNLKDYNLLLDNLSNNLSISKSEITSYNIINKIEALKHNGNSGHDNNSIKFNTLTRELNKEDLNTESDIISLIQKIKNENELFFNFLNIISENTELNMEQNLEDILTDLLELMGYDQTE